MAYSPITSWQIEEEKTEAMTYFIFFGPQITVDGDCRHEIKRHLSLEEKLTNLDSILESRDLTLPMKICVVKATVFSSSLVWIQELDHKEDCMPKNLCFLIMVLEKTLVFGFFWRRLERPLDCTEIKPVNLKVNQPYIFIGRTVAETEALILGPLDSKSQLTGKYSDAGKDWRSKEKGVAEDEMVR